MSTWRHWLVAVLTASCLIVAGGKIARAAEPSGPTLAVTVDGFCICHAPAFVADDLGIFRKHGVDVRLTFPATGFEALTALGDGSAQVAAAAPGVVAQVRAKGTAMTGLFMAFGDATGKVPTDKMMAVVARKSSGVRAGHLEDLKGKKIGLPRGTIVHQYLFYALTARGLDGMQDVIVQATPPGELANALESGAVDAIAIWEPVASQALAKVKDTVVVQRGGNVTQFLDLRVVAPQYLAANSDQMKRFILAFAEAAQYARKHPEETTGILMRHVTGLDRATVRRVLGYLDFDLRISKATVAAAQQGYDFAVKLGALQQAPKLQDMIDPALFDQVAKEHPELFADLPPIPRALRL